MKLFSQESAFNKMGTILFDLLVLNLLVTFGSMLTIGIAYGALNTAMIYAIHKTLFEKQGYVFANFKKSLKLNFVQATVIWLILLAIALVCYYAGMISISIGGFLSYFAVIHVIIFLQVLFIIQYAFSLLALVDIKTKDVLYQSFLFANKHLWASITALSVVLMGLILTFFVHGAFMMIVLSGVSYINYRVIVKGVLIKYFSEEQKKQLFSEFDEDQIK